MAVNLIIQTKDLVAVLAPKLTVAPPEAKRDMTDPASFATSPCSSTPSAPCHTLQFTASVAAKRRR